MVASATNFGVRTPLATVKRATVLSPLFTTARNAPELSIASPAGKLLEVKPVGVVVGVVPKTPPAPMGIAATVPSPSLVTNRNFPAGSTTAWNGALIFEVTTGLISVRAPAVEIENAETVLPVPFGTNRKLPVGSIAGICGSLSDVNGPEPIDATGVR